jgi:hypothetical protein
VFLKACSGSSTVHVLQAGAWGHACTVWWRPCPALSSSPSKPPSPPVHSAGDGAPTSHTLTQVSTCGCTCSLVPLFCFPAGGWRAQACGGGRWCRSPVPSVQASILPLMGTWPAQNPSHIHALCIECAVVLTRRWVEDADLWRWALVPQSRAFSAGPSPPPTSQPSHIHPSDAVLL